jgi:mannose-6-phosphate isomerase
LSLQVHPRTSRPTGGEEAKIEAWLFLDADRESRVWLGFAPGVRPEQVEAAAGTSALVPLVRPWPARTGECVLVRGGTVHAIGAGIALLEVQENSDTTHRLYDWDRPGLDGRPRAMHVGPGLRAIDWDRAAEGPHAPVARAVPGGHRAPLVDCSLFSMERLDVEGAQEDDTGGLALLLAVLSGRGRLRTEAGDADLAPGDVWLLPASIGRHRVESSAGKLSAVRIGTKP